MTLRGRTVVRAAVRPLFPPLRAARWLRNLLQTRMTVIKGDAVIYRRDPALFGLMTVYLERPDGRIVCALASPEQLAAPVEVDERFRVIDLEIFDALELEPATPPAAPAAPGLIADRPA